MKSGISVIIRSFHIMCACIAMSFYSCATTDTAKIKQAELHNNMGNTFFNEGKINEAYAEFQQAISLDPGNREALNQLGYLSAQFKKYNEAISYYNRAISSDPNYSEAKNNLGLVYLELEKWNEAIKYFRSALSNPLYRSPEKPLSSMGYAYYRKGEYAKAENSLKEAILRNPIFYIAYYTLGLVYVKHGDDRTAIDEFQKAVNIMPDYMDAHWELAHACLRSNITGRALKHFRIIAERDPNVKRSRKALEYLETLE